MKKTKLHNQYEVENIIRKSLPPGAKMPFYANDTDKGIGHTYKFHRSSANNNIWSTVLDKLHSLGLTEWAMSCPWDYSNEGMPMPAKWIGIRSARLPRRK